MSSEAKLTSSLLSSKSSDKISHKPASFKKVATNFLKPKMVFAAKPKNHEITEKRESPTFVPFVKVLR